MVCVCLVWFGFDSGNLLLGGFTQRMSVSDLGFCLCCFLEALLVAVFDCACGCAFAFGVWMWWFGVLGCGWVWLLFLGTCGFDLLLRYSFAGLGVCWADCLFGVGGFRLGFCRWVGLIVVFAGYVVFAGSVLAAVVVWVGLLGFTVSCGVGII